MTYRTDLAEEAHAFLTKNPRETTRLSGVKARAWEENGLRRHRVEVLNRDGAEALGKPIGRYETFWMPNPWEPTEDLEASLAETITELLDLQEEDSVLLVGLGNRSMTPDCVGPMCADGVLVTRHLRSHMPELFGNLRPVSALVPGVLGTTGMESLEVVKSVIYRTKPQKLIVVDALAAAETDRLCRVIQVTDAGIVPGSGVGNSRSAFSRETLGVPAVAIGAVTVTDAGTPDEPLIVTSRDVDAQVKRLSSIILRAVGRALFPHWRNDELQQFMSIC